METTGQLSVCKKAETQPPTIIEMGKTPKPLNLPVVVISDGDFVPQGLQYCSVSEDTVKKLAKKQGRKIQDIFLMTCTPDQKIYIVPKDKPKKGGKAQ